MSKKYKKRSKSSVLAPIIFMIALIGCLILCIAQYISGEADYDKLEQREYTFVKYEVKRGPYGGALEIYVEEENRPLLGSPNYIRNAVDMDILEHANKGDRITVWVSRSITCGYNVHEGKINGKYFLRLEDYREYHAKNYILGIVICSILIVICSPFAGVYLFIAIKSK